MQESHSNEITLQPVLIKQLATSDDNVSTRPAPVVAKSPSISSTVNQTKLSSNFASNQKIKIRASYSGTRRIWTEDEDKVLRRLVEKYGKKHWKLIARELGTKRLETECRQHYCRVLERKTNIGRWTYDEIILLQKGVELFSDDWVKVASYVKTRDKNQCISKWKQMQTPKKSAREWTNEEHNNMLMLYNRMPNHWKEIAQEMGNGITPNQVRNHFQSFARSKGQGIIWESSSDEMDYK